MFVGTGRFVPVVKEPGYEVVDACDDGNAGAACPDPKTFNHKTLNHKALNQFVSPSQGART